MEVRAVQFDEVHRENPRKNPTIDEILQYQDARYISLRKRLGDFSLFQ